MYKIMRSFVIVFCAMDVSGMLVSYLELSNKPLFLFFLSVILLFDEIINAPPLPPSVTSFTGRYLSCLSTVEKRRVER